VNHVAFWMPALLPLVPLDLDELLEDRGIASNALGCETSGVMIMTVNIVGVLVVRVGWAKECAAECAGEVFDVELLV
jgi:hypothetical protein